MSPLGAAKRRRNYFDSKTFLSTIDRGRELLSFRKGQPIFAQGDSSDAVFYIQKGKVRLTVVSNSGKEATIAVLNEDDFFGEACLTGQALRLCSAAAMTGCLVMRIDRKSITNVLRRQSSFSEMFIAHLLARNMRYEEDLVDHLFNSSEKRLARVLLLLARIGKDGKSEVAIPKLNQQTLAEMVGTTRARISFFMTKFRKLGFVRYNGELRVHSSLLNVVLHD